MKIALLFLLATPSQAALPFCPAFEALKVNAISCDDNFVLGKKADECLSRFTTELVAKRGQVEKQLQSAAQTKGEQTASFSSSTAVFQSTVSQLDQLISSGEQARFAVDTYGQKLSLPEDYDQPAFIGMTTEKYLAQEPCYATPNRVISENKAVLELMVDDLKKAKTAVLAKSGITQGSSSQMNSANAQPAVTGGKAPATPGLPKESTIKNRDSDVTGTILKDPLK